MAYKFYLVTILSAMVGVAIASPEAMSYAISKLAPETIDKVFKMHTVMSNPGGYENILAPEDIEKSEAKFARGLTAYVDSWSIDRSIPFAERFNSMVVEPCQEVIETMAEATEADLTAGKEEMTMWDTYVQAEKYCTRVFTEPSLWADLATRVAEKNSLI